MFVSQQIVENSKWQWSFQYEKPVYLNTPEKDVAWFSRNFARRFNNSITAANMALPFLEGPAKGLTIAMSAEAALPYVSEKDPVNIINRIWKPSLPVIHLAMAVLAGHKTWFPDPERPHIFFEHLLKCDDLIRFVVSEANKHREIIKTVPRLRTASARLIHFQLT